MDIKKGMIDQALYRPTYAPWESSDFQVSINPYRGYTLISPDRLWILATIVRNTLAVFDGGEIWECGVYKGGSARMMADMIRSSGYKKVGLKLFDTFAGMPETNPDFDYHKALDFADTNLEEVKKYVGELPGVSYHKGLIPETFKGLEKSMITVAHIDVDIYQSVIDCCEFIYPRMESHGIMIFDDYGFPSCPGALLAVNKFFDDKPERPLVLPTGQAIVFV